MDRLQKFDEETGVLTVGLVSEKIDWHKSYIDPEGCVNQAESIVIDFRHSGLSIGCKASKLRIVFASKDENDGWILTTDNSNNGVKTLIMDIKVPKTSRLRALNSAGQIIDHGNTYEAIKNDIIQWGSVDGDPSPYPESTFVDGNGRKHYKKFRILRYSLLDVMPSQEQGIFFSKENFRSIPVDIDLDKTKEGESSNAIRMLKNDIIKVTIKDKEDKDVTKFLRVVEVNEEQKQYVGTNIVDDSNLIVDFNLASQAEPLEIVAELKRQIDEDDANEEPEDKNEDKVEKLTRSVEEMVGASKELYSTLNETLVRSLGDLANSLKEIQKGQTITQVIGVPPIKPGNEITRSVGDDTTGTSIEEIIEKNRSNKIGL